MGKKKLAGIIAGSIIGIITIIIIIVAIATPTHTYTLSVSASPSGTGSISPYGGEYESGAQVTLTASPASGYTFDHWSGSASGTTSTVTITMDSDKSLTANFKAVSAVSVDYEVTALYGTGYLNVRVEGPQKSYEVLLFDPEGERVGYGFISSDDMLSGHKTVEVSMTGIGVTNPAPGEYWLIVKEWLTDEKVFEARPIFAGSNVSITNVQFETNYYDYLSEGDIDGVTAQVHNSGDLPVLADKMKLMVAGKQEDITIYESLPNGETTMIEGFVYISGLDKGTHLATVEIYSEGVKLASYTTQVTIG